MSFIARLQRAREILAQQGRLSTRALERELEIAGDELDELIEELVDVQQVARREGKILVWAGPPAARPSDVPIARETRPSPPTRPADTVAARGAEARKVVTIIFADLIGSTSLHERLDPESVTRLMERYYRAMRGAVEAYGGTVVKLMGDGVMAAFGVPRVAEDDAIRAVRAGVAMQDAFREFVKTLTPSFSPKLGEGKPAVPPLPAWERGRGRPGPLTTRHPGRTAGSSSASTRGIGPVSRRSRRRISCSTSGAAWCATPAAATSGWSSSASSSTCPRAVSQPFCAQRAATGCRSTCTASRARSQRAAARWRALCADDLVYADHRRTGLGHLEGPDAFVDSLLALWDLAPLTRVEAGWFWPAYGRHGAVTVVRRSGTLPDGGAFESEYLELFVQAGGRATHLELFELDDLDAALARFEALRAVSAA